MQQAQACKVKERYIISSFTVSLTNLQGEWRYEKIDINDDLRSFKKKKKNIKRSFLNRRHLREMLIPVSINNYKKQFHAHHCKIDTIDSALIPEFPA